MYRNNLNQLTRYLDIIDDLGITLIDFQSFPKKLLPRYLKLYLKSLKLGNREFSLNILRNYLEAATVSERLKAIARYTLSKFHNHTDLKKDMLFADTLTTKLINCQASYYIYLNNLEKMIKEKKPTVTSTEWLATTETLGTEAIGLTLTRQDLLGLVPDEEFKAFIKDKVVTIANNAPKQDAALFYGAYDLPDGDIRLVVPEIDSVDTFTANITIYLEAYMLYVKQQLAKDPAFTVQPLDTLDKEQEYLLQLRQKNLSF